MALTIIKQLENSCKTESRPRWYITYLVECSNCRQQYPMLKKNFREDKCCVACTNRIRCCKPESEKKKRIHKYHLHHMHWTPFHKKRECMRWRCNYPCVHWYKNYWGRGIKCEREKFEDFKRDMYDSYLDHVAKYGEDNTTIDRIDVNWNYSKENCRWLTKLEQQSWKRNNHSVVYQWVEYPCLKALCRKVWQNYHRVHRRIKAWWDTDRAINTLV